MSQTPLSNDKRIDALLSTYKWGDSNGEGINLTYSFPTDGSTWITDYDKGRPFSPYTTLKLSLISKQSVREVLQLWSNIANINFLEVNEPRNQGDFRFAFSNSVFDSRAGVTYLPAYKSPFAEEVADVWINSKIKTLKIGSEGYSILIHEIGHGLGLKHSFEFEEENPTILSNLEESIQYTVMSNIEYENNVGWSQRIVDTNRYIPTQNTTPMLYDILAIQFLYGANTSYNTGNNIYTFNNEAELKTIWDAGGIDTFDLTNQHLNLKINLNAGEFSSIGDIVYELNDDGVIKSVSKVALDNIAIAYGVEIENAIGGSSSDTIIGNYLANQIAGGEGTDTVIYTGNKTDYIIETVNERFIITRSDASEGTDELQSIERLQFNDTTLALDIEGNAGQAYRLYQAAFNRTPDKTGLGFWINALDKGDTLEKIGIGFIQSQEFTSLYGATPTDDLFLSSLYNNVLHRDLDTDGYNFWINQLQMQTRENVLIGFSESQENKLQVIGNIQNGIEF